MQSITGKKTNTHHRPWIPILMAILAAALYGISAPFAKLLLVKIPPTLMASLLYLGAGFGMLGVIGYRKLRNQKSNEAKITRQELPYTFAMIVLDIMASIFLMVGLSMTSSQNASLLSNFEIVVTSLIALNLFKEAIGKKMWIAIFFITVSSMLLSIKDFSVLSFSFGSLFVLLGCICWGLENNITRMLSIKDPLQIVVIKGLGTGVGSFLISLVVKEYATDFLYVLLALLLGFVAYGLSIYFYVRAQRDLGAGRTSAYYAMAPFIGVIISWLVLNEHITLVFLIALVIMCIGTYFAISEIHEHRHSHLSLTHEHKHDHSDGHHNHIHDPEFTGEHSHEHKHEPVEHEHDHLPDIHHRHSHR